MEPSSQPFIARRPGGIGHTTSGLVPSDHALLPNDGERGELTARVEHLKGKRIKNRLEQKKKDRLQQACVMLNAKVLPFRDLEAFLISGEGAGPPNLSQRTEAAKALAEHWQAVWQANKPSSGHELRRDDEADDQRTALEPISEAAPATTSTPPNRLPHAPLVPQDVGTSGSACQPLEINKGPAGHNRCIGEEGTGGMPTADDQHDDGDPTPSLCSSGPDDDITPQAYHDGSPTRYLAC